MTGEMSRADVTREEFPLHFAIADAMKGEVHPFDVYQGPYVVAESGTFWIQSEVRKCDYGHEHDTGRIEVYNEHNGRVCVCFPCAADVVEAAKAVAVKPKKARG